MLEKVVTAACFPHSSHGKDASPGPLIDVSNIPTPRKFLDATQYSAAGGSSGKLFLLYASVFVYSKACVLPLGPSQEIGIKPLGGPGALLRVKTGGSLACLQVPALNVFYFSGTVC